MKKSRFSECQIIANQSVCAYVKSDTVLASCAAKSETSTVHHATDPLPGQCFIPRT